jgi:hypothetical protein
VLAALPGRMTELRVLAAASLSVLDVARWLVTTGQLP